MVNSSIWSIDRTLSGATTLGQNGPGSNSNEEVFHIPQSSTDWSLTIWWFNVMSGHSSVYSTELAEGLVKYILTHTCHTTNTLTYMHTKILYNAYMHTYALVYRHAHIHICTYRHINTYIYIHMQTYIHTCTHIYAYTYTLPSLLGCRIHWLHLCRGVRPPQWVS